MSVTENAGTTNATVPEETGTSAVVPALSFKEQLSRRRRELESNTTFEMRVEGYDDLWARYRPLGYEDIRGIGLRIEEETDDQITGERLTAAETLAEACVDLLQFKGLDEQKRPIFENLGHRWSWQAGRELFELDIPEGVAARDVVTMIFPYPRDMLLMNHFQGYLEQAMSYLPEIEEILLGESRGRSDATMSPFSRPQP